MNAKKIGIACGSLFVAAAIAAAWMVQTGDADDISTGPIASQIPEPSQLSDITRATDSLAPSAYGVPSGELATPVPQTKREEVPDPQAYMGGTTAKGRVERVFVQAARNVLIDLATAAPHQRNGARFVAIAFPDPLANGTTLARALITDNDQDIGIGDIVEMRFAHKNVRGPGVQNIFPVIERDKVTAMVSKSGTEIAQEYQRRIAARSGSGSTGNQIAGPALWEMLPLNQAVKIVHGNGKNVLAVFSDPYCPACQPFERTLQQIDDVTVYVFMLPAIRPERSAHSKSVWCSPDRAKAWVDLTLSNKVPDAAPTCDNPIDSNLALIKPVDIRATPTVIFANGQRAQGNILASALRERIAQAESASLLSRTK